MTSFQQGVDAVKAVFDQMWSSGDWDGQVSMGFASSFDQAVTELGEPLHHRITAVLVAHQRKDIGSCLCGWSDLGRSHAGHQATEVLAILDPTLGDSPQHEVDKSPHTPTSSAWCMTCAHAGINPATYATLFPDGI